MGKLVTETPYSEITATLELLDCFGVERDDLTKFRKASSYVQQEVVRLIKYGETHTVNSLDPVRLLTTVDYSLTLEQMIVAGHYDWSNPDITKERFPVVGEGKVVYENKIFDFGKSVSSEEARDRIKAEDTENPWSPWVTEQTLAFGATYPEKQRKFWIVGLGSSCEVDGGRCVLILREVGSGRRLSLDYWGGGWYGRCRFGAARRLSA